MAVLRAEGLKLDFGSMFKLISMANGEVQRRGSHVQWEICFPGGGGCGGDIVDEARVSLPPLFCGLLFCGIANAILRMLFSVQEIGAVTHG